MSTSLKQQFEQPSGVEMVIHDQYHREPEANAMPFTSDLNHTMVVAPLGTSDAVEQNVNG
jgi:hypothetical protein